MKVVKWIEEWFKSQCNDDWEHRHGIEIRTLDNPGWSVKVDLSGTPFQDLLIENPVVEKSEDDWYSIDVKDGFYKGYGDPSKLEFLLLQFREIVEKEVA